MPKFIKLMNVSLALLAAGVFAGSVLADSTLIEASRDNTLYENAEGALSNGAGDYLFVGRTQANGVRRAVIAFDDLSSIPAGSVIESVRLHLQLSRESSAATTLSVSRLVSDWGEGASDAASQEGGGAASAAGDATWIHTFYDTDTWLAAGGDFLETPSAQLEVDSIGAYTIESTAALVADVQDWLDNPETNFGWILTANESGTTAKRFDSRENTQSTMGPVLDVTFTAPGDDTKNSDWSGIWYDPTLDGEGYQIFDTEVGWVIFYFGYTPDQERLWLISETIPPFEPEPDQSYTYKVLVGTPGSWDTPTPGKDLPEWGVGNISFDSCDSGLFTLESPDLRLLKISQVIKLAGAESAECFLE